LYVSVRIKYFLPNLYKLSILQNFIEFDSCARVLLSFHSKYSKHSGSKSRGLVGVRSVAAHGVSPQKFRHWSAEASSDRLLGSAKPWHTEPSDWSAAKKTDYGYQGKGWSY